MAQMIHLESDEPDKDISLYINSPGGDVYAGLAIYDTMRYVRSDVQTICFGMAMSMGAILLAGGAKGKRIALPNSKIMIHQGHTSGFEGQATDVEIRAREILVAAAADGGDAGVGHRPHAGADPRGHPARQLHGRRAGQGVRADRPVMDLRMSNGKRARAGWLRPVTVAPSHVVSAHSAVHVRRAPVNPIGGVAVRHGRAVGRR